MERELRAYAEALYAEGRAHDAPLEDRLLRLRNMTPAAAGLIAVLIRVRGARRVLEIGTSNGYSALWFADAVRDTGGTLTTVEIDPDRAATARGHLAAAGLAAYAEVVRADGAAMLAETPDAAVDLLVLDAERPAYTAYWPQLRRILAPRGVIAVDNSVSHAAQVADFRAAVEADPDWHVHLHETGDGVLTAVRIR